MFERIRPLLALALGLVLGASITLFAGENPLHILAILFRSSFGSAYDFGMSLAYATPLIFTGLAVSLAFRGGLFNIGAEGQLTVGALAAVAVGVAWPSMPAPFALVCAMLAAAGAGALWAGLAGLLKSWRGSHEVITTIMLNFIAAGLTSYAVLYLLRNRDVQSPESLPVGDAFRLPMLTFFDDAPASTAIYAALIAALLVAGFLRRTTLGFRLRALGMNEQAAATAAIDVGRMRVIVMMLSGALAGLAGLNDVLGGAGRYKLGFSADYGFTGIAVALLGRSKPLGVVFAAFLFGALQKGAADLDFETDHVTRDLATVMQACVILAVCADGLWDGLRGHLRRRAVKRGRRDKTSDGAGHKERVSA